MKKDRKVMKETAAGKIVSMDVVKLPRSRFKIFELVISDGTGALKGKWFNQPFMKKNFSLGREVILSGVVKRNPYWGIGPEIENPEYEFADEDAESLIHTSRVVPVDRTTLRTQHENVYALGDVTAISIPGRWKPDVPMALPKAMARVRFMPS